jgi:hypothetical protein
MIPGDKMLSVSSSGQYGRCVGLQMPWGPLAQAALSYKSWLEKASSCPLPLPPLTLSIYLTSWERNKEKSKLRLKPSI